MFDGKVKLQTSSTGQLLPQTILLSLSKIWTFMSSNGVREDTSHTLLEYLRLPWTVHLIKAFPDLSQHVQHTWSLDHT